MAKVLVVGGAGYVGGSTCAWLLDHGHDVWVLDDLSRGHREFAIGRGFTHARAGDRKAVSELLSRERFDCVMHFAAYSLVAESVARPEIYIENNIDQTRALLELMHGAGVRRFVFSSTCAVFGDPTPHVGARGRIAEDLPKAPINPYGETKLEVERMLARLAEERGLHSVALRYFNASGAEPKLRLGEWHEPESHLIPRVLKAAVEGTPVEIYGTDYPTQDGTCVRDYVHVWDLASAHGAAMERLLARDTSKPIAGKFEAFNLGSENGFSVREVVQACEQVVGKKLNVQERPRRPGDPPFLVGDSTLAKRELGYNPQYTDLKDIIQSAWDWEKKFAQARRKAVFLDRDGTINEDPGYLSEPDQLKLFPGVGEALAKLKCAGYVLVIVSNQSGVGRGLIAPEKMPKIHERLADLLKPSNASIDHYELCIHRPEDGCYCRKPKPKLLLDAAHKLGVDLSRSFMIGDKLTDIDAGCAAGCRASVLVRTGMGLSEQHKLKPGQASVAETLTEAADWILSQET